MSKMCILRVGRVAAVDSQIWSWISAGRREKSGKVVAAEEDEGAIMGDSIAELESCSAMDEVP